MSGAGGNGEMLVKMYKLSVMKLIRFENLIKIW